MLINQPGVSSYRGVKWSLILRDSVEQRRWRPWWRRRRRRRRCRRRRWFQ